MATHLYMRKWCRLWLAGCSESQCAAEMVSPVADCLSATPFQCTNLQHRQRHNPPSAWYRRYAVPIGCDLESPPLGSNTSFRPPPLDEHPEQGTTIPATSLQQTPPPPPQCRADRPPTPPGHGATQSLGHVAGSDQSPCSEKNLHCLSACGWTIRLWR